MNCCLIEDDPLTLVDTGPNSGKALDELERQLADRGRRIEDLELVIITHQHIDHLGLIEIVAKRSGAEVAAIDISVDRLRNFSEDAERDDEWAGALMLRYGIPDDVVTALRTVSGSFRAWGAQAEVTRPLRDGESLALRDRSLEVQHRPGHSPSDTVFWDSDREILLAADHLIAHISSNPLLARPLDGSDERSRALMDYIASMRLTRELPASIVLPGHGEPITDHRKLIDDRLAMHRRRAQAARPDRRRPSLGVRAGAGHVGERRRDAGVPHPVRGRRPRRPPGRLGPGRRGRGRGRDRPLGGDRSRGRGRAARRQPPRG